MPTYRQLTFNPYLPTKSSSTPSSSAASKKPAPSSTPASTVSAPKKQSSTSVASSSSTPRGTSATAAISAAASNSGSRRLTSASASSSAASSSSSSTKKSSSSQKKEQGRRSSTSSGGSSSTSQNNKPKKKQKKQSASAGLKAKLQHDIAQAQAQLLRQKRLQGGGQVKKRAASAAAVSSSSSSSSGVIKAAPPVRALNKENTSHRRGSVEPISSSSGQKKAPTTTASTRGGTSTSTSTSPAAAATLGQPRTAPAAAAEGLAAAAVSSTGTGSTATKKKGSSSSSSSSSTKKAQAPARINNPYSSQKKKSAPPPSASTSASPPELKSVPISVPAASLSSSLSSSSTKKKKTRTMPNDDMAMLPAAASIAAAAASAVVDLTQEADISGGGSSTSAAQELGRPAAPSSSEQNAKKKGEAVRRPPASSDAASKSAATISTTAAAATTTSAAAVSNIPRTKAGTTQAERMEVVEADIESTAAAVAAETSDERKPAASTNRYRRGDEEEEEEDVTMEVAMIDTIATITTTTATASTTTAQTPPSCRRSSRPTRFQNSFAEAEQQYNIDFFSEDEKIPYNPSNSSQKKKKKRSTGGVKEEEEEALINQLPSPAKKARRSPAVAAKSPKRRPLDKYAGADCHKDFGEEYGWYWGVVTQVLYPGDDDFDPEETVPYVHVQYLDGDEEDLGEEEMLRCVKQAKANIRNKPKGAAKPTARKKGASKKKTGARKSTKKSPPTDRKPQAMEIDDSKAPTRRATKQHDSMEVDEELAAAETKMVSSRQLASFANVKDTSDVEKITAIMEEFHLDLDDEPSKKGIFPYSPLDFSFSDCLWNAINSNSPHVGAQYLTRLLLCQYRMPSQQLWKNLLTLMVFGPQDGDLTYFPDRTRMDLAVNYVELVFEKLPEANLLGLAEQASDLRFFIKQPHPRAKTPYWKECLHRVSEPYYTAPGDEIRTNLCALERIGQSIHAKACCLEVFASLLEVAARPCLEADDDVDYAYREQPILCKMLSRSDGARGPKVALETALKALISQWIMLGHFAQDTDRDEEQLVAAAAESQQQGCGESNDEIHIVDRLTTLQLQSVRLLEALAKVCSYAAWLYMLDADEDALSVATIVREVFLRQVEELAFEPPEVFLGDTTNDEYWISVKLSIVVGFDKVLCPTLRPYLADALGVAKTYNACYGRA